MTHSKALASPRCTVTERCGAGLAQIPLHTDRPTSSRLAAKDVDQP